MISEDFVDYLEQNPLDESLLLVAVYDAAVSAIDIQYDYAASRVSAHFECSRSGVQQKGALPLRDFRRLVFREVSVPESEGLESLEHLVPERLIGRSVVEGCRAQKCPRGYAIELQVSGCGLITFSCTGAQWEARRCEPREIDGEWRYFDCTSGKEVDFWAPFG